MQAKTQFFIQGLKAPVLIVHAEDDGDIPVWHAQLLFDALLERHLPPVPGISEGMVGTPMGAVGKHVSTLLEERAMRRKELVTMQEMERFGRLQEFSRDRGDGKVVFLHTWWGAHDVGLVQGVQDFMGEMFRLG
jgi:abhydrolase domain-containing protein 12